LGGALPQKEKTTDTCYHREKKAIRREERLPGEEGMKAKNKERRKRKKTKRDKIQRNRQRRNLGDYSTSRLRIHKKGFLEKDRGSTCRHKKTVLPTSIGKEGGNLGRKNPGGEGIGRMSTSLLQKKPKHHSGHSINGVYHRNGHYACHPSGGGCPKGSLPRRGMRQWVLENHRKRGTGTKAGDGQEQTFFNGSTQQPEISSSGPEGKQTVRQGHAREEEGVAGAHLGKVPV